VFNIQRELDLYDGLSYVVPVFRKLNLQPCSRSGQRLDLWEPGVL